MVDEFEYHRKKDLIDEVCVLPRSDRRMYAKIRYWDVSFSSAAELLPIVFHTALCMQSVQKAERGYCPKIMLRLNLI